MRLWQSGFELFSPSKEFDSTSGTLSVSNTGIIRSGITSLECNPVTSHSVVSHYFSATNQTGNFYYRTYIYIASLPTSISTSVAGNNNDVTILALYDQAEANFYASVALDGSGVLRLYDASGASEVVVATSSALSTGRWYRLELAYGAANGYYELLIDGTSVGSTSGVVGAGGVSIFEVGVAVLGGESCTADIYFDDLAINDTSGSFQTSWPGDGKIIHLHPATTGDKNTFATQVGGTAGSTQNWTRVKESTPDDATSYNASLTLNQEDLFKVGANTLGAGDTINTVMVGLRFSNPVAVDATTTVKAEIEKASGGTITQSAAIVPNSRTWRTNQPSVPRTYPIVTYQDPDGANWTNTTLGTMQIGYKLTTANVNSVGVSTVWAAFDYTPAPGASPVVSDAAAASESVTLSEASFVSASDTATTSENVSVSIVGLSLSLNVADTVVTSESAAAAINAIVSVSDSTATAESIGLLSVSPAVASDSAATSENIQLLNSGSVGFADAIAISESITLAISSASQFAITVSDTLVTAENVRLLVTGALNVNDPLGTTEAVSALAVELLVLTDSTTLSENIKLISLPLINASDSTVTSENTGLAVFENVKVSDVSVTSESMGFFFQTYDVSVSDTLTTAENLSAVLSQGIQISVSDSVTTSESIRYIYQPLIIVIQETRLQDENSSYILDENGNIIYGEGSTEVAFTSESINVTSLESIGLFDVTVTAESVSLNTSVAMTLLVTASDTAVTSENLTIASTLPIRVNDTALSNENAVVNLPQADTYIIVASDSMTISESLGFLEAALALIVGDSVNVHDLLLLFSGARIIRTTVLTVNISAPIIFKLIKS